MTRIPPVSGRELMAALGRKGFQVIRVKGSHHVLRHADGRMTVVPVHGREEIGPGLLAKILRDCDMSRDELRALL
ncbi:MAG: addiction module toxin, HicA family [Rhodospirillales bacterium]|nr:addiction module toxin, HicA family [Rhodospirillales bacterium]